MVTKAQFSLTPGYILPETVDKVLAPGYSKTVRPSRARAWTLKLSAMRRYKISLLKVHAYTLDHLVPLSIGGHPTDKRNLWPQPKEEALLKDRDEATQLNFAHAVHSLAAAQRFFIDNWTERQDD
jgi:hypothetical protein